MSEILDQPHIAPPKVSPWKTGGRWGLIGVAITTVLTLLFYVINIINESWAGWIMFIPWIMAITMAMRDHRNKDLGGYISYGKCLSVAMVAVLVMSVIGAIVGGIFYHVIAPELMAERMAKAVAQMEEQGMSDEQVEQAISMFKIFSGPLVGGIVAIIGGTIMGLVIALVSALFVQKKR